MEKLCENCIHEEMKVDGKCKLLSKGKSMVPGIITMTMELKTYKIVGCEIAFEPMPKFIKEWKDRLKV